MKSRSRSSVAVAVFSALTVILGCARQAERAPLREETVHMYGHFGHASEVQNAMIQGDLDAVRAPAQWLAEHDAMDGLPKGSDAYLGQLRQAAAQAVDAPDLPTAAKATAAIARACGACHGRYDVGPRFTPGAGPPAEGASVSAHMIRHVWAADRMWEGLIGPSEASWAAGARGLSEAPLEPQEVTDDAERVPAASELAHSVHDLGARAQRTTGGAARAEIYGELLTSCSSCHSLVR